MILLKNLLLSSFILNEEVKTSEKILAIGAFIKNVWNVLPKGEDKFDAHGLFLWMDNDHDLSKLAQKLADAFYPDNEDALYHFKFDVEKILNVLEQKYLKRRQIKTPFLKDPIYLLKKIMVGKSWKSAKREVLGLLTLGSTVKYKAEPSDEWAEEVFARLYKNALGETIYDESFIKNSYGRFHRLNEYSQENPDTKPEIDAFIRHYYKKIDENNRIQTWRGVNNPHAIIRPGDFVTLDRKYASTYVSGKWKAIITENIHIEDLFVYKLYLGATELIYWPEGHSVKKYSGYTPSLKEFWETYRFGI